MTSPPKSPPPEVENREIFYCKTSSVLRYYDIEWEINNFSFILIDPGQCIDSSRFRTCSNPRVEWCIRLYPNGDNEEAEGEVSVYLVNLSEVDVTVKYSFSILDSKKTKNKCNKSDIYKIYREQEVGFTNVISREELLQGESSLLVNDTLTLLWELQVVSTSETFCFLQKRDNLEQLSQDFKRLFSYSDSSDLTISVGDIKFPVHKTILGARSTVFAAMFRNDMEEKRCNIIEIKDVGPKVMQQVLIYIYSGKCEQLNDMTVELLKVADKYDLGGLKDLCEDALTDQLNIENASNYLIISDLYNTTKLKHKVLDYIKNFTREVITSNSWKNMASTHPDLELEGLRAIVNYHISNKK